MKQLSHHIVVLICLLQSLSCLAQTTNPTESNGSKATTLSVHLMKGEDTPYHSIASIQIVDAKGSVYKRDLSLDSSGTLHALSITPGVYHVKVEWPKPLPAQTIEVKEGEDNRLNLMVPKGELRFEYYEEPGRLVTEYESLVNIRFEPGPTVRQPCSIAMKYPPGNYYVEVNTNPITRYSVPIDYYSTSVIYVPTPGQLKITNKKPIGIVELHSWLGGKFVRFYDTRVDGIKPNEDISLKPGSYQAHWIDKKSNVEKKRMFHIESKKVTTLQLD